MTHDTPSTSGMQRSLRQCLSHMATQLYRHGHVLETVTVPHRGLERNALKALSDADRDWTACQHILETSQAATWNDQQRFVLTGLGRELLFDMFGEGAADCA
ncbi:MULTISPECIES: hypothetical protein [Halomonas]|uniref:Winged helix DNA-binding protein n=1 Tax=Halomonas ventosae TaxID=229007 RepID=A0A4R6GSS0_9GAMM|nr:hypothetical protein [Halomonas ventosae]TDN98431.1 hypothetical protein DFO68_1278 [Halomonas ventosae]